MRSRVVFFLSGFVVAGILGFSFIQYARGVRFDIDSVSLQETGILVATSQPNAAQVFVNGKLTTATNQNIDLAPDTYDIQISKEGYFSWSKRLTIEKGAVTKTDAILFPKAPSLSPITFDGAKSPFMSPDGTKLVWTVTSSPNGENKVGLWTLELANLPFGFARNARQITDADFSQATLSWSPDGRNILAEKPKATYMLGVGEFKPQGQLVSLPATRVAQLKASWQKEIDKETQSKLGKLPDEVRDVIERKTSGFLFSEDQTKVLYTSTASASFKNKLIEPLPGSSTQKQERDIKSGFTYLYDIKEDRNFLILENSQDLTINHRSSIVGASKRKLIWFPTSRHLILAEPDKIELMEYDGTNRTILWTASYESPFAFISPDGDQLIILTSLGTQSGETNLYTINLR